MFKQRKEIMYKPPICNKSDKYKPLHQKIYQSISFNNAHFPDNHDKVNKRKKKKKKEPQAEK